MNKNFKIGKTNIGGDSKTYFIADIAANHDGSLKRALKLIKLAAQAGANAAKFQHFKASTIVSDKGFKDLGNQLGHQLRWKKSVFEVYNFLMCTDFYLYVVFYCFYVNSFLFSF